MRAANRPPESAPSTSRKLRDALGEQGHFMAWLDRIPLFAALVLGLALGLAPFQPEPHVVQKLRMLSTGALSRPLDIFDLFWHGLPLLLLALKLVRLATGRAAAP